jgi:ABC-type lipoprotein export system ATPase subunit
MPLTEMSDRHSLARTNVGTANAGNAGPVEIFVAHLSKIYPIPFARLKALLRRKSKPPVEALRDVSFDVRRGEIFGFIGRNGAGKTTLTKIVATLVQPTSGTVTVGAYDSVHDDVHVRMRVGLANAEERSFYWRLTAEQNLLFFARLYGMSTRTAKVRIADLFRQLELEDVARRRFGEISTGNKQRLAVARALLSKPPVLFSGVFFPTQLLKEYGGASISSISRILPPTYGINGIRAVLIEGRGLRDVQDPLMALLLFLAVLLPFSLWVFGRAIRRAKREGSLIQY